MLKFLKPTVSILFSILFFLMLTSTLDQIDEVLFSLKILKSFLSILIPLGVYYFLFKKKISKKLLNIFLFAGLIVALLVRLRMILTIEAPLKSDFALMFSTANQWLDGNKDAFSTSSYYDFAVFNIPFTLYLAFVIKYLGGLFTIKLLNVFWSVGIVFYIYKITKKLFNPQAATIALFMAALFPPFIIYTTILTNQTISIFFIMLGLYFLICRKQLLLCSLFVGLGHIFRPIGTVFIIGILGYIILQFIDHKNIFKKDNVKNLLVSSVKIILPFQMVMLVVSGLFFLFNITNNSLYHNPAPSYKLLVGLNPERTGQYSNDDAKLLKQNSPSNFEKLAKQKIAERTSDKVEVLKLFEEKFKLMWGKRDGVFFWADYNSSSKKAITNYFWLGILFFCLCFVLLKKASELGLGTILIFTILLGFIIAYIFIEIQTRYRYEIYPLFIILSSQGFIMAVKYLKTKLPFDTRP